jgi:hypothetical protein
MAEQAPDRFPGRIPGRPSGPCMLVHKLARMLAPHRMAWTNLQNNTVRLVPPRIDEQSDETRRALRVRRRLT